MGDTPHHPQGPSTLVYLGRCPAFLNHGNPASYFAIRGTLMHEALELVDDSSDAEVTEDPMDPLTAYEKGLVNWIRDEMIHIEPDPELVLEDHRELTLHIAGVTFGTVDRVVLARNPVNNRVEATMPDYKFGEIKVPVVKNNAQFIAYALGVFERWPEVDKVHAYCVQPKLKSVNSHTWSRRNMSAMRKFVIEAVAKSQHFTELWNPETYLHASVPGGVSERVEESLRSGPHCAYCARSLMCPKIHRNAMRVSLGYDEEFKLPDTYHPSEIDTPDNLRVLLEAAKILEKWVESAKHHVKERAKEGVPIGDPPIYALKEKAGKREVTDVALAVVTITEHMGGLVDEDDILDCCSLNLSTLEKKIKEGSAKGKGAANVRLLGEVLASEALAERGSSSLILQKVRS